MSVALCSYNGERFLSEQLHSIAAQSRLPNEIVVSDDGSTDRTIAIANDFAATTPVPVRILAGEQRLGTVANFSRAVAACSGEIIVVADQDDVWSQQRLETVHRAFATPAGPGLVFSDGEITDENLRPLGRTCWDSVHLSARDKAELNTDEAFATLLRRQILKRGTVTGATLAFRAEFAGLVLPVPDGLSESRWRLLHDAWISLLVAAVAPVRALPDRLVLYRQHADQQLGLPARRAPGAREAARRILRSHSGGSETEAALAATIRWLTALLARLEAQQTDYPCDPARDRVSEALSHLTARSSLPPRGTSRWRVVRSDLRAGRYGRYANGRRSAAWDLVRP